MINALLALLICQLLGETASRGLNLPLPGPVLGMILLLVALGLSPKLVALVRPVAQGILAHMSLLFVPAGVGVVGHFTAVGSQGPAILLAVTLSTIAAIVVGVLTFVAVARVTGNRDDEAS